MRSLAIVAFLLTFPPVACAWPFHHRVVHQYKIVSGDGGQSILEGESIRTRGLCVEIILHGRVDTIVCAPKYVTELPPEPATAPEAKPTAEESGAREVRR